MEKQDLVQICKDCGKEFTITASEQEFYESKELALPKRCADCRKARKMQTQDEAKIQKQEKPTHSMRNLEYPKQFGSHDSHAHQTKSFFSTASIETNLQ